jgi:hypothetical protein
MQRGIASKRRGYFRLLKFTSDLAILFATCRVCCRHPAGQGGRIPDNDRSIQAKSSPQPNKNVIAEDSLPREPSRAAVMTSRMGAKGKPSEGRFGEDDRRLQEGRAAQSQIEFCSRSSSEHKPLGEIGRDEMDQNAPRERPTGQNAQATTVTSDDAAAAHQCADVHPHGSVITRNEGLCTVELGHATSMISRFRTEPPRSRARRPKSTVQRDVDNPSCSAFRKPAEACSDDYSRACGHAKGIIDDFGTEAKRLIADDDAVTTDPCRNLPCVGQICDGNAVGSVHKTAKSPTPVPLLRPCLQTVSCLRTEPPRRRHRTTTHPSEVDDFAPGRQGMGARSLSRSSLTITRDASSTANRTPSLPDLAYAPQPIQHQDHPGDQLYPLPGSEESQLQASRCDHRSSPQPPPDSSVVESRAYQPAPTIRPSHISTMGPLMHVDEPRRAQLARDRHDFLASPVDDDEGGEGEDSVAQLLSRCRRLLSSRASSPGRSIGQGVDSSIGSLALPGAKRGLSECEPVLDLNRVLRQAHSHFLYPTVLTPL